MHYFEYFNDRQELNLKKMKRNWVRRILGGLSFTTALFVFQACYGTPQDFGDDLRIDGEVRSKTSGNAIQGIKVTVENSSQYDITDFSGRFVIHTDWAQNLKITFEDIDGVTNNEYSKKDTVITPADFEYHLYVNLEKK